MNITLSAAISAVACTVALACAHEAAGVAPTPVTSASQDAPPDARDAADTGAPALVANAPAVPLGAPASATTSPPPSATSTAKNAPKSCIEVDDELGGKPTTLEGVVFVDEKHEHPSRGKTRPFILRLDAPRCAVGISERTVKEVHLAATDAISFKPLVGHHVRVSGDPFMSHTAWHARPIVLLTSRVTDLP